MCCVLEFWSWVSKTASIVIAVRRSASGCHCRMTNLQRRTTQTCWVTGCSKASFNEQTKQVARCWLHIPTSSWTPRHHAWPVTEVCSKLWIQNTLSCVFGCTPAWTWRTYLQERTRFFFSSQEALCYEIPSRAKSRIVLCKPEVWYAIDFFFARTMPKALSPHLSTAKPGACTNLLSAAKTPWSWTILTFEPRKWCVSVVLIWFFSFCCESGRFKHLSNIAIGNLF